MEIMKIRVQWLGVEKEKCVRVVGDVVKATFWDEDKFLVPLATKKGFIKYCQDKEITSANLGFLIKKYNLFLSKIFFIIYYLFSHILLLI